MKEKKKRLNHFNSIMQRLIITIPIYKIKIHILKKLIIDFINLLALLI